MRNFRKLMGAIAVFAISLPSSLAFARAFTSYTATDCLSTPINISANCGGNDGVRVAGSNGIMLQFDYTRSAGTGWSCDLEIQTMGSSNWRQPTTKLITNGVVTLSPMSVTRVVSANDSLIFTLTHAVEAVRLRNCLATGTPDASDLLTVSIVAADTDSLGSGG